jgi:hypothetical protein
MFTSSRQLNSCASVHNTAVSRLSRLASVRRLSAFFAPRGPLPRGRNRPRDGNVRRLGADWRRCSSVCLASASALTATPKHCAANGAKQVNDFLALTASLRFPLRPSRPSRFMVALAFALRGTAARRVRPFAISALRPNSSSRLRFTIHEHCAKRRKISTAGFCYLGEAVASVRCRERSC